MAPRYKTIISQLWLFVNIYRKKKRGQYVETFSFFLTKLSNGEKLQGDLLVKNTVFSLLLIFLSIPYISFTVI